MLKLTCIILEIPDAVFWNPFPLTFLGAALTSGVEKPYRAHFIIEAHQAEILRIGSEERQYPGC